MSVPNLPPSSFQNNAYFNVESGLNMINTDRKHIQTDIPVDSVYSKPNQQYKEYKISENPGIKRNYAYRLLTGIQQVSLFSLLFFSNENIAEIQRLIKYNVFHIGNFRIDNQDETELILIMRSNYLQYSKIPQKQQDYTLEIARLNEIVVEQSIRTILSEITQQQKYLYDIENRPYIESYGVNDSVTGNKQIRDVSDIIFAKTTNTYNNLYNADI